MVYDCSNNNFCMQSSVNQAVQCQGGKNNFPMNSCNDLDGQAGGSVLEASAAAPSDRKPRGRQ